MRPKLHLFFLFSCLFCALFSGCAAGDGDGDEDNSDSNDAQDFTGSNSSGSGLDSDFTSGSSTGSRATVARSAAATAQGFGVVLESALQRDAASRLARSLTAACPETGSASLNATISRPTVPTSEDEEVTLRGIVQLEDCNGWSGVLDFDGTGGGSNGQLVFHVDGSGDVDSTDTTKSCAVTFESLSVDGLKLLGEKLEAVISGSATAKCDGATVNCKWNGVEITDRSGLEAGCR